MKKTYYVLDGENNTIWHGVDNDDCPMEFDSFSEAEAAAIMSAECDPNTEFRIVGVEAVVKCPIGKPKTLAVK